MTYCHEFAKMLITLCDNTEIFMAYIWTKNRLREIMNFARKLLVCAIKNDHLNELRIKSEISYWRHKHFFISFLIL